MQTALASSLRNGGTLSILSFRSSSILSHRSLACFYSTRRPRPSTLASVPWPTAPCDSAITLTVTPRARLVGAFPNQSKASSSRASTSTPTSTPTSNSTAASTSTSATDNAADDALQSATSPTPHFESPPAPVGVTSNSVPTMNGANNTSPRGKRKQSPFDAIESGRAPKHHRLSLNGRQSAGDNTPDVEAVDLEMQDDYIDDAALQALPSVGPDSFEWQDTIENVVRNVVSIRFCQTCSFDTDPALNSEATGFVVDAERGYILTNRHVVGAGPFWGYCIFDNHEEVDAYPVYRDPVHDFGILKFDPKAIKYMPVKALTLRPDLAKGRLKA